jgi:hypothetical protein
VHTGQNKPAQLTSAFSLCDKHIFGEFQIINGLKERKQSSDILTKNGGNLLI